MTFLGWLSDQVTSNWGIKRSRIESPGFCDVEIGAAMNLISHMKPENLQLMMTALDALFFSKIIIDSVKFIFFMDRAIEILKF